MFIYRLYVYVASHQEIFFGARCCILWHFAAICTNCAIAAVVYGRCWLWRMNKHMESLARLAKKKHAKLMLLYIESHVEPPHAGLLYAKPPYIELYAELSYAEPPLAALLYGAAYAKLPYIESYVEPCAESSHVESC